MNKWRTICIALLLSALTVFAEASEPLTNLIIDCSFENPLPLWFKENGSGTYYAAKEYREDAAAGTTVMVIKGWQLKGSTVWSPVIEVEESMVSFSAMMRAQGTAKDVSCEIVLFDAIRKKQIASLVSFAPDGNETWQTVERTGLVIPDGVDEVRLAFVPKGPHLGTAFEIDSVGLFGGGEIATITNNASFILIEAEDIADGIVWQVQDHYRGQYREFPRSMKMLAGNHIISDKVNNPLTKSVNISRGGKHKLWVRYVTVQTDRLTGTFTVSLKQGDKIIARKEVKNDRPPNVRYNRWVWTSIEANLKPGKAQIVLERPAHRTARISRKIDCFLLTDHLAYEPNIQHFKPAGYMRFVNESETQDPFCLWIRIRRQEEPKVCTPGILSHAGIWRSNTTRPDKGLLLAAGDTSAWVRITDFLLQAGGINSVTIMAKRASNAGGYVEGRIKGKLEFALGNERKITTIP